MDTISPHLRGRRHRRPFSKAREAGFYNALRKDLGFPDEFVFQKPTGLKKDILVPQDAWSPMHVAWERSDTGFYLRGVRMGRYPWRNGFKNAPISGSAKKAFDDMELFRTPPRRDDWERWLDSMTYLQFLKGCHGHQKSRISPNW